MLKDIIVLGLIVFLIYLILNRYILPIFRITTAANSNIRKMQEHMQAQMKEMERNMNQPGNYQAQKKPLEKEGDYIDYEEI